MNGRTPSLPSVPDGILFHLAERQGHHAAQIDPPVNVAIKGDVSCKAFHYLTWSTQDTPITIDGVRRHNAAYSRICK